jgi:hypothetical protein
MSQYSDLAHIQDVIIDPSYITTPLQAHIDNDTRLIDTLKAASDRYDVYAKSLNFEDVTKLKEKIMWNMYTYKRYKAINRMLWVFSALCVMLIVFHIIYKFTHWMSDFVYSYFLARTMAVGAIVLSIMLLDFLMHDRPVFDEYDFSLVLPGGKAVPPLNNDQPAAKTCQKT